MGQSLLLLGTGCNVHYCSHHLRVLYLWVPHLWHLTCGYSPVSISPVDYSPVSISPVDYSPVSISPVDYSPVSIYCANYSFLLVAPCTSPKVISVSNVNFYTLSRKRLLVLA